MRLVVARRGIALALGGLLLAAVFLAFDRPAAAAPSGSGGGHLVQAPRLRFADEFTGAAGTAPGQWKALTNWIETGNGPLSTDTAGWHLDGQGHLVLTSFRQPNGSWRGSIIDTPLFSFTYGEITFRAMVAGGGPGPWGAVWAVAGTPEQTTFPTPGKGGEIDFMESPGRKLTNSVQALHSTLPGGGIGQCGGAIAPLVSVPQQSVDPLATAGWHDYKIEWLPGHITWIVDGQVTFDQRTDTCTTTPWEFEVPHRLRLMMLAGGSAGNPPAAGPDHYTMLVDYVRVAAPDPAALTAAKLAAAKAAAQVALGTPVAGKRVVGGPGSVCTTAATPAHRVAGRAVAPRDASVVTCVVGPGTTRR